MDIKIKVGQRIKQLRESEGITQAKLAERAQLDRTYITSVENGKRNISLINIKKIADAFNMSLKDFFEDL